MYFRSAFIGMFVLLAAPVFGEEPVNINAIKSDLIEPEVTDERPAAGRRVRLAHPDYSESKLTHVLYLPPDWKPGRKYPVLVEYPGNGGYENKLGDRSTGRVEDCKLGFGLSGGTGMIWLCLPFVDPKTKSHSLQWWGDPDATAKYCREAVAQVVHDFGGDPKALVLTGFSRGAIACGYIGLRDDETAKLWKAIIAHSHFDGVRRWGYPGDDADSALKRWHRWKGRPLFVSHERDIDLTRKFLTNANIEATISVIPYPNHSPDWLLKDIPERTTARKWLGNVLEK